MKFVTPSSILICGPSMSGKSYFTANLIKHKMFDPWPEIVIWCFSEHQPLFDTLPGVEFVKGFNSDAIEKRIGTRSGLVLIDDLMNEAGADRKLADFFTKKVHHRGISVCFLVQRMFPPHTEFRTMSRNTSYLVVFKNPRDRSEIQCLGSQVYPKTRFLQESFHDATLRPHGYIVMNFKQSCDESLRVMTNILPHEAPVIVYVRK